MLLCPEAAPLARTLERALAGSPFSAVPGYLPGSVAFGSTYDEDDLEDARDPRISLGELTVRLIAATMSARPAEAVASSLVDRESVLDLGKALEPHRPPTLFEHHALVDVLGELAALLPPSHVRIDRALLKVGLNHCEMDGSIARIRLLPTNGRTLAGRTHALVHEMGHALIGVQRASGRDYCAAYGQPDYGRFLRPHTFDHPCDEEALVRAIADAWLLRRRGVTWSRTWPGAIDEAGRNVDGDDLAAWCRFRLAQGLGLPFEPVPVRRA
ncbi:MAG: hypothetical protein ACXVEF_30165 [Polyangiales bacterium]